MALKGKSNYPITALPFVQYLYDKHFERATAITIIFLSCPLIENLKFVSSLRGFSICLGRFQSFVTRLFIFYFVTPPVQFVLNMCTQPWFGILGHY